MNGLFINIMFADFLGMSDIVWQALIGAVVTIVLAYMSQRTKDAVDKGAKDAVASADKAAVKADAVKEVLGNATASSDSKLNNLTRVANDTHTLVNSAHGATLRLNAELSRWKANQTRDTADIAAADLAERKLREHEAQQKKVDQREDAVKIAIGSGLAGQVEEVKRKVEEVKEVADDIKTAVSDASPDTGKK